MSRRESRIDSLPFDSARIDSRSGRARAGQASTGSRSRVVRCPTTAETPSCRIETP